MTRGVTYVAFGADYVEEAETSARSLKDCMPATNVALVTDAAVDADVFDDVVQVERDREGYEPTFLHVESTPYDRTVHLDADTYVTDDISELFDLLDRFDFLAARAPYREQVPVDVPAAFTELNGGVVGFNSNLTVDRFFSQWREEYDRMNTDKEQPAFRKALYHSDIEFYVLPPEYNCREMGYVDRRVKIVHQRREDTTLESFARKINAHRRPRVFFYRWGRLWVVPFRDGLVRRAYDSVRTEGLARTLAKAAKKIQ